MRKFSLVFALVLTTVLAFAQKKHTVEKGNTLSGLAKQYYNDFSKWTVIYKENSGKDIEVVSTDMVVGKDAQGKEIKRTMTPPKRIVNPNLIYPGQILVIPNVAGDPNAMSDADIMKAMVGEWENTADKSPIKFNSDGTYAAGDKKGKYSVSNGMVMIEGMGTFKPDAAKLKAGTISITPMKDAAGKDVANGKAVEFKKKGAPMVEKKTMDVAGKVTDKSSGAALAGVKVSAGSASAMTDASGMYKLTGVAEGSQVAFSATDYKGQSKAAAGTVNAELESSKPKVLNATVEFEVKAGKAGKEKAVPGAKVTATNTKTFKAEPTDKKGMTKAEFSYEENVKPQFKVDLAKYEVKTITYDGKSKYSVALNPPGKKAKDTKTKDKKTKEKKKK